MHENLSLFDPTPPAPPSGLLDLQIEAAMKAIVTTPDYDRACPSSRELRSLLAQRAAAKASA